MQLTLFHVVRFITIYYRIKCYFCEPYTAPMKRIYTLFLLAGLFMLPLLRLSAQDDGPQKLTHWLTSDERLRLNEIGKNFVETDPPIAPIRNVAEFDRMQGALVRYPFGIPVSIVKELAEDVMVTTIVASPAQQTTVTNIYISNGVNMNHCNFLIAPTDSYWTRDYGPWFESDSSNQIGIVDFPYNRPRPNDDEIPKLVANMLGIPWFGMNVIHTGGNYMTDGLGISSSTTLVWEENPTQTHEEIAQKVNDYLGIGTYQVVEDPNGTYIDHIDCWGKFLAPDRILIRQVPPSHPRYTYIEEMAAYWAAQTCSYGYNYHVYRVNTPNDQPYTNSIIVNNKVLVPIMNSTWDDSAIVAYQNAMPGYEVIGFTGQPSTPWESTDALHCRVMGIADVGQLYIRHIPLTGNQPCEHDFQLSAEVIACSGQPVYPDSVLIWYRVNNGAWLMEHMTHTAGQNYTGAIPEQPCGSTVEYYLYAADESGRHETCPLIGPADPFKFNTVYTDLAAIPDTLWFRTIDDMYLGKSTYLHNYTASGINLMEVQAASLIPNSFSWYVDSITSYTFPYPVAAQDSFYIRVKVPIPLDNSPTMTFLADSMWIVTPIDTQYVIIMLNDSLLFGSAGKLPDGSTALLGNSYPNPVNATTTIPFTLTEPASVKIEILDLNGRSLQTLVSGNNARGLHEVMWNCTGKGGTPVPPGIYICRMTTGDVVVTKRIVVIR
jgi:agmatine deiminase